MMKAWMKILVASSILSLSQLSTATIVDKREVIIDENGINRLDRDGVSGKTETDAPRHSIKHTHRKGEHDTNTNLGSHDDRLLSGDDLKNTVEEF